MNKIEERVTNCFINVFPGVDRSAVRNASTASLDAWDSVAHITLLSAIFEDFGIDLDVDDYEELTSYSKIVKYLEARYVQ